MSATETQLWDLFQSLDTTAPHGRLAPRDIDKALKSAGISLNPEQASGKQQFGAYNWFCADTGMKNSLIILTEMRMAVCRRYFSKFQCTDQPISYFV